MFNVKARLLVDTILLAICLFAAGWAEVLDFVGKVPSEGAVSTAIHKLMRGELLRESRPPQRNDSGK